MKTHTLILTTLLMSLSLGLSATYYGTAVDQPERIYYEKNIPIFVKNKRSFSHAGKNVNFDVSVSNLFIPQEGLPQLSNNSSYMPIGLLPQDENAQVIITVYMGSKTLKFVTDLETILQNDKNHMPTTVLSSGRDYSMEVVGVKDYMTLNVPGTTKTVRVYTYQIRSIQQFKQLHSTGVVPYTGSRPSSNGNGSVVPPDYQWNYYHNN